VNKVEINHMKPSPSNKKALDQVRYVWTVEVKRLCGLESMNARGGGELGKAGYGVKCVG
jgi:hypothetical protein